MECDIFVYNLKPEKEDHAPRAGSPISADSIDATSFFHFKGGRWMTPPRNCPLLVG